MGADQAANTKTQQSDPQLWGQSIGYVSIGLGAPCVFAGFMVIDVVFLPGRSGQVLAEFRWDHPAFVVGGLLLAIGTVLVVGGLFAVRLSKQKQAGRLEREGRSPVAEAMPPFRLPTEIYTKSRPKLALVLLFLLSITVWLGSSVVRSPNVVLKYGIGLPMIGLMAFVIGCGVLGMIKPQRLELGPDGISVIFPWTKKTQRFRWKDVAEIKTITGQYHFGILLDFGHPDANGRRDYYLASGWAGVGRGELLLKMKELWKDATSE